MRRRVLGVALALTMWLLVGATSAQTPDRQRALVYGFYAFDGLEYATGFVPPSADTIYLLADRVSVLDPKLTEIYYWPITNEYRADFAVLNEPVAGALEITSAPGTTVGELTDYVIQVDQARARGGEVLATGPAARARYADFERQRAAFIERMNAYARANAEYQQRAATKDATSPPPAEPEPFTLFSTNPGRGFALTLPAGEYRIRLRDATGAVAPGSEKRVVAIAPQRQAIGYDVVPQSRWTRPEASDDPGQAIFSAPSGVVYLQPFKTMEFNALEHARLRNPQDRAAVPNRTTWVRGEPIVAGALDVAGPAGVERLAPASFAVVQAAAPALGYTIQPVDASQPGRAGAADLRDYFRVAATAARGTLRLSLVDDAGRPLAGGAREIVVGAAMPDWVVAVPVVLPLLVGLGIGLWRRRQVQAASTLTADQRQRMA